MTHTIYALSTAVGKSGVAVIRVSGPDAQTVLNKMTKIKNAETRKAYFSAIFDPKSKETIDHGLVLFFKSPSSFTGEDVVELQVHGSIAVIEMLLTSLSKLKNFKMAEPGEFSKRAFYNSKMDLTQAEGLADLIDAQTSSQQRVAIRQMEGELKGIYEGWRENLISTLAYLEAYVDFPEEDIPQSLSKQIENNVKQLKKNIKQHLKNTSGERLRDGFRVVIVGPPNAGKSSLLNSIVKREAAIVSDIAGTTRDAIDVFLDIGGYPVIFTDTAGLRDTKDKIEQIGVKVALSKLKDADLVICLYDGLKDSVQVFESVLKKQKEKVLLVANKADKMTEKEKKQHQQNGALTISAKQKSGIDSIFSAIKNKIAENINEEAGGIITRSRYRESLEECLEHLERFDINSDIELCAEDIRLAARSIGKITGKIEVNDILNKIFGSFCIGK